MISPVKHIPSAAKYTMQFISREANELRNEGIICDKKKLSFSDQIFSIQNESTTNYTMSTMNFSKSEKPCPKEKIIGTPIQCRWTVEDDFAHGREFQVYLTGKNQLGNVTKTYDVIPENYGNAMFYFNIHVLLNCVIVISL